MPLIIEDGSTPAGANSYASLDTIFTYADAHGLVFAASPSTLGEQAAVRATSAIDATYRGRFPGYRSSGRLQSLEWPRGQAYDVEGLLIDGTEIPQEIIDATCEAAIRELASPGSMMPDLERGGSIQRLKAGSVEIDYGANASARTVFTMIDGILSRILGTGGGGGLFGVSVRG
jgi:hypothetical protein